MFLTILNFINLATASLNFDFKILYCGFEGFEIFSSVSATWV